MTVRKGVVRPMFSKVEDLAEITGVFQRLQQSRTLLRLFGGKGGVGKTTCAAATALHLAESGKSVLVVSSDPAPSLSDIFEQPVGSDAVLVRENLSAMEIDATGAMRQFKQKYGEALVKTLSGILPVDNAMLDDIPDEPIPGLDELFAMERVMNVMAEDKYDYVIWDTAPTGHTLRLLALPGSMASYASGSARIYLRISGVLRTLRGWLSEDDGQSQDTLLEGLQVLEAVAQNIGAALRDARRAEFVPVVIPEALAVQQTEALGQRLSEHGIFVGRLIINGIVPRDSGCEFCRARASMQQRYIRQIKQSWQPGTEVVEMPLFATEIKGLELVRSYAALLCEREDGEETQGK